MLADVMGKLYHKYLRHLLTPYINSYILSSMCGGFEHRGVDFASLYINGFQDYARKHGLSWAVLFLDVSAAFESLQRFFVYGARISDAEAVGIFKACGMMPEMFEEFRQVLLDPTAFEQAGVPRVLQKLVEASHLVTWYSFSGLDTFVATRQGAKPGDPLGDIIFAFLICSILKKVHRYMSGICKYKCAVGSSATVLGELPAQEVDISSVNYVDDNAFLILGQSSNEVLQNLQCISGGILDIFGAHLLRCSLAANKTAVLLGLLGRGQRQILGDKRFFEEGREGMCLKVKCTMLGDCRVPVVKRYKHVGRHVVAHCSNNVDVQQHVVSAHTKFSSMAYSIIGNRDLPVHVRLKFSLIPVSRMLSCASVWYNLSPTSIRSLDSQYNKIYRTAYLGHKYHTRTNYTNKQFYEKHPHRNVLACIRGRRLRLLSRILAWAPEPLKALLADSHGYQKSFINELYDDLGWLWRSSSFPEELNMPDPASDPLAWNSFIINYPNTFKKRVQRAEEIECTAIEMPAASAMEGIQCHICGFFCKNVHVYSGHMHRAHGHKNPLKMRLEGSQCLGCMKDFRNRCRLFHHLSCNSPKCGQYYLNTQPLLDDETFKQQEAISAKIERTLKAQGRHAFFAELPVIRLVGPVPSRL